MHYQFNGVAKIAARAQLTGSASTRKLICLYRRSWLPQGHHKALHLQVQLNLRNKAMIVTETVDSATQLTRTHRQ
jgi:hypothetical protein